MTPVRIVDRGQFEGSDISWRPCGFGGDPTKRVRVSVTEHVIEFVKRASYDYDVDDIAVAFIEMTHEQGHQGGEFIVGVAGSNPVSRSILSNDMRNLYLRCNGFVPPGSSDRMPSPVMTTRVAPALLPSRVGLI